jgi:small redox-active disulfide protein 2
MYINQMEDKMMEIKALGGCCMKSAQNLHNIQKAAIEIGLQVEIKEVSDINEIMSYGVLITPGLVINGIAVSSGHLLSVEEAKKLILEHMK